MTLLNSEYFTFNGSDIKQELEKIGVKFIVNNTTGRGLISQEHNAVSVVAADGERLINTSLPVRVIVIEYTMIADDLLGLRRAEELLGALLVTKEVKPLSFKDQLGQYEAIYESMDVGMDSSFIQQGSISFRCPKPFRYGAQKTVSNVAMAANTPYTLQIEGNHQTEPIIELRLTSPISLLSLRVNGVELKYTGSLVSGAVVKIDSEKLELRVNNVLKVLEVDGAFPVLKSKVNTFTVNSTSQMSIYYRDKFI